MVTEELGNYVRGEVNKGITRQIISESLLKVGWSSIDIEQALNAVFPPEKVVPNISNVPIQEYQIPVVSQTPVRTGKKFVVALSVFFVVVVIFGAYFYRPIFSFLSNLVSKSDLDTVDSADNQNLPVSSQIDSQINNSVAPVTEVNNDDSLMRKSFEKIREASIKGDISLMSEYSSSKTLELFTAFGGVKVTKIKDMTLDAFKKINENTVLLTITKINLNDRKESEDIIFVKENEVWKIGLVETMEYLKNKTLGQPAGDTVSGYVDFVVTDINVYPSSPKVNNEETEIEVSIKNQGTISSGDKGVPARGEIIGSDYIPVDGGPLYRIDAGQTVKWGFHPYPKFFISKHNDEPGRKTVTITLNSGKEVLEKDYSNNVFGKDFDFIR